MRNARTLFESLGVTEAIDWERIPAPALAQVREYLRMVSIKTQALEDRILFLESGGKPE